MLGLHRKHRQEIVDMMKNKKVFLFVETKPCSVLGMMLAQDTCIGDSLAYDTAMSESSRQIDDD